MKKLFLLIFFLLSTSIVFASSQVAIRQYFFYNEMYYIEFRYDDSICSIPLTLPPGQPHYTATIEVSIIREGIGKIIATFPGQYTPDGCFEDEPEYLVKKAISLSFSMAEN